MVVTLGIVGTILIGMFVGLIARFLKPGDDSMGLLYTALVGIVGALVGRFIGQALGIYSANEPAGFIGAVAGAVIVLSLLSLTNAKKITHRH